MQETIKQARSVKANKGEPEIRAMMGVEAAIILKFKELLREFQEAQTSYKVAVKKKIKRQIEIVKPDMSETEKEEYLNDPNGFEVRNLMSGYFKSDRVRNQWKCTKSY